MEGGGGGRSDPCNTFAVISRHERYLLSKLKRMNQSRPELYPPDTLVKIRTNPDAGVFVVDHNSGEDTCHLKKGGYITKYPEKAVRPISRLEFFWYKDPKTGGMKIGKNRAIPILLWLLIMLACSVASVVGAEGFWRWFWPGVTALAILGVIVATLANYRGKQA